MLKKILALAASTAMLGANAAAQAITSVRAAVKGVGAPAGGEDDKRSAIGTSIQPSIPPMPPEPVKKAVARKDTSKKDSPHKTGVHKVGHKVAADKNPRQRSTRRKSKTAKSR